MPKKYIIAYVKFKTAKAAEVGILKDKNHKCDYKVYADGNSKDNKREALDAYESMINDFMYYSVSLTKVIESTDY